VSDGLPTTSDPRATRMHLGIAEHGKVLALQGQHAEALACYREAIRLAVSKGDPEVFFRHYTTCVLESLERMGSYAEIIEFCDRAVAHYDQHPPPHAVALWDLAAIHMRRGLVLIKAGEAIEARAALAKATATASRAGGTLPLATAVAGWLARGFAIDTARVTQEQERHDYYSVRPDTVRPALAIRPTDTAGAPGRLRQDGR